MDAVDARPAGGVIQHPVRHPHRDQELARAVAEREVLQSALQPQPGLGHAGRANAVLHPLAGVRIDHARQVTPHRRRVGAAQARLEVDLAGTIDCRPVATGRGPCRVGVVELGAVERDLHPFIAALPATLGAQTVEVEAAGIEHRRQVDVHARTGELEAAAVRVTVDAPRQPAQAGPALARQEADVFETRSQRPVARRPRLAAPRQAQVLDLAAGLEARQPRTHAGIEGQIARQRGERGKVEPVRGHRAARRFARVALIEPQREIGGRDGQAVGQGQGQATRAEAAALFTARQRQPPVEPGEIERRQRLPELRLHAIERDIRGHVEAALAIGVRPRTHAPVAGKRQRVIEPRLPAAEVGALEFHVHAASRRRQPLQADEARRARHFATHDQRRRQRRRRPRIERKAHRAAAPLELKGHAIEHQRGRRARLVLPGHARAVDEDLALGEQPGEPAAVLARARRKPNAGHEDLSRRIAAQHHIGRLDVEAVEMRLAPQQ